MGFSLKNKQLQKTLDGMTILCSCDDLHDLATKLDDLVTKYEDAEE